MARSAALAPERLIPAYAGSTRHQRQQRQCRTAHPRLRGEHSNHSGAMCPSLGSSPLTRGARGLALCHSLGVGLIPAYAGSTRPRHTCHSRPSAHPRLRGEHLPIAFFTRSGVGSSPLTRGAPCIAEHNVSADRLIPAYAGSTSEVVHNRGVAGAHPRLRGEHTP